MRVRPMVRQYIGRVADLRLRFLERQPGSGRHFGVVAEGRSGVVGMGSLETLERLPDPWNLSGKEGYALNVYVEPEARGRGAATDIVRELVGITGREGVGRLWLHATSGGRGIYEAGGFESRSFEEMQLVLPG